MSASPQPLTLPELAALSGVGYRTLHSWLEQDLIRPSIQVSRGKGVPNLFSAHDAFIARVLGDLRRLGVALASLRLVSGELRIRSDVPQGDEVLALNGEVEIRGAAEPVIQTLSSEQPTVLYHLGWTWDEVERDAQRLRTSATG